MCQSGQTNRRIGYDNAALKEKHFVVTSVVLTYYVRFFLQCIFCNPTEVKLTLSMSTESSANHCLASFCCTTHATCKQAVEEKDKELITLHLITIL